MSIQKNNIKLKYLPSPRSPLHVIGNQLFHLQYKIVCTQHICFHYWSQPCLFAIHKIPAALFRRFYDYLNRYWKSILYKFCQQNHQPNVKHLRYNYAANGLFILINEGGTELFVKMDSYYNTQPIFIRLVPETILVVFPCSKKVDYSIISPLYYLLKWW